jgi:hypothetical protein
MPYASRCVKRELPRLLQLLRLDVGRRNAQAHVPVAVCARAKVAGQREQGADLPTRVLEVDPVHVLAALLLPELAHCLEVVAPEATADGERGEGLAICGHVIGFRFYGSLPHAVSFCVLPAIGTALSFSADVIGSASRNPEAAMQWLLLPQMIPGLLSVGVQPAELFRNGSNRLSATSPLLNGFTRCAPSPAI